MRWLTGNFLWKLLSLLLSIGLWLTFAGETELATSIPASVQYKNVPQDLELDFDAVERLYLEVQGPSNRLSGNALAQTSVLLDLGSVARLGEWTFTLDSSNVRLPVGVRLTRIIPSQVRVRFERRVYREVPVELQLSGPPAPGYRLASATVQPTRLRIVGSERRVNAISEVLTDPVDPSDVVSRSEFRVPAHSSDPHVRFADSPIVTVNIELAKIK